MDKIQKAKEIATIAHEGVTRKNSNDPYIVHPERVAKMVAKHGGSEDMICAAWLHDVKEDAPQFMSEVYNNFSSNIINLIDELSKPEGVDKLKWIEDFKYASREAVIIKMADRIDNLLDVESMGKKWLKKYLIQTEAILIAASYKGLKQHRVFEILKDRYTELKKTL